MSLPSQKRYLEFRSRVTSQGGRFYIQVPKAYNKDIIDKEFYSRRGNKKVTIDVRIETV